MKSIFLAEFHPQQGPRIIHEYPTGFFLGTNHCLEFEDISEYVIPKPALCNHFVRLVLKKQELTLFGLP